VSATSLPDGSEPANYYVPVGGETQVPLPTSFYGVTGIGVTQPHAPQVIYRVIGDNPGPFYVLVPPADVARVTAVIRTRI
jgi:hypothetical protein